MTYFREEAGYAGCARQKHGAPGDATDHGGRVIEATNELKHSGIGVELFGHLVMCPKC